MSLLAGGLLLLPFLFAPDDGVLHVSVQIGDDEHRTIEGLCETITIRMEDGI